MLDKYGLPLELKYLPIVESALNPKAKSSSGATGLWQFMYLTGIEYNLKVTSYILMNVKTQLNLLKVHVCTPRTYMKFLEIGIWF